ncbi:MAG: DUF2139 domain-containing protein [Ignisphaera sp.]|nr:DUF2139 domain-containing protein [Ignisphaera sp.]
MLPEYFYSPRYGPEWGSGGIFGLKYHRGVLYYTLAFEAVAHFIRLREGYTRRYRFELVGPLPTSGGDTYNAVEAVDDVIYFGGWVHAPAVYKGREKGSMATISFVNKHSHVHAYSIAEDSVKLLWKESLHHETDWVGEISEIIYDEINDRLLLAREDGMVNLGLYQIDRRGGNYKQLSPKPALKGSILYDHACFDVLERWWVGANGIQCLDLVENRMKYIEFGDISKRSIDGGDVFWPITGVTASAYGRFFLFVKGGLFVGNPIDESIEEVKFVRLLDFVKSGYNPRRTMAKPVGGGILVAYNPFVENIVRPTNEIEKIMFMASNTIVAPSLLLYITPPTVRIVGAFGARITGIEVVGDEILLACDTMANSGRYDAQPIDAGYRSILSIPTSILNSPPPPIRITVRGEQVDNKVFGGIPLAGYREAKLVIQSTKSNKITIYEYDLSLPPLQATSDRETIAPGKNVIDLHRYGNSIVSFKLDEPDPRAVIRIDLL